VGSPSRGVEEARAADHALLARRLREAGLAAGWRLVVHENRRVLLHVRNGTVRLHRGFAYAPDATLQAVVVFTRARRTAARRAARQELVSFPVHDYVPPPPACPARGRARAGDAAILRRLRTLHAVLNARHFGGLLTTPAFRVSHRTRRRLGAVTVRVEGCEISIGRRHVEDDGWDEVERTLLHEMVHQWQVEQGLPPDHGRAFRRKAQELGIEASARRTLPGDAPDAC
jgi:hypothetical protein